MSRLTDALAWSGRDVTLILVAALPRSETPVIVPPANAPEPLHVRQYHLEDPDDRLPGRSWYEYDLIYEQVPPNLEVIVSSWALAALAAGADFVWFGFAGSFDFDHILTHYIADQIFAIGASEGVDLALTDDLREGPAWAARLRTLRDQLGT